MLPPYGLAQTKVPINKTKEKIKLKIKIVITKRQVKKQSKTAGCVLEILFKINLPQIESSSTNMVLQQTVRPHERLQKTTAAPFKSSPCR